MHTKNQISLTRKTLYGAMLITVFIAAFGAGSLPFVNAQSNKDQSNIYIDPEFGFKLDYPYTWRTTGGSVVDPFTYVWAVQFIGPSTDAYVATSIEVFYFENKITLSEWVSKVISAKGYDRQKLEEIGAIDAVQVDGVAAFEVSYENVLTTDTIFINNNFGYIATIKQEPFIFSQQNTFTSNIVEENVNTYKNILSSMKLSNKQPSLHPEKMVQSLEEPAIADSFGFPVGYDWTFEYGAHPTFWAGQYSPCFQVNKEYLFHAGQDRAKPANTAIFSVANGQVYWYDSGYSNYPGRIVIVRHRMPDGSSVYSMYGHLNTVSVSLGQNISKGTQIGTILDQGSNSHVHWEIRYNGNMGNIYPNSSCNAGWAPGPGYTYPNGPDSYGYTNPVNFVNAHSGGGGNCGLTSIPSGYNQCANEGGYCSFSGTANVIYGANSCYTSPRSFSNGTACNNDVFGDPLSGVQKFCYTNGSGGGGSWGYQLFDLGDYNGDKYENNQTITNLTNVGWNDRAESIKINSGYEIIACEHADFQGNCGRVKGPAQFSDINALASGLRNGLSSIKVCAGSCPNVPSAPSLSSPANGQFFNEGESITLSWSATGSEYYGEITGGPSNLTFGWQTGTSKNIGSQWAGYTYNWKVKAKNSVGESGWSNVWNFTVRPGAPTNLNASAASCSQINLSWNDNSGNEEGYKVYRNGGLIATLGSGVTSYQNTGLSAATSYSYTVEAFRGNVESNASNTASATTTSCGPGAPTLNSPANNAIINRADSVSLSWNAVTGATQYYAEFWGGPGTNINSTWISGTSWSLGSQWSGVYQWRVKAKNNTGQESGWSETRTLNIRPGTPSNLSTSVLSSEQIRLSWSASSDAPGNIDGYRIYRNGSAVATVSGSENTYQNNGLSCNTSYSFFVRAYKGSLESNSSNTVNAITQPCPPAIHAIEADTRDGEWELKSSFVPGDPIQWTVHVENTTDTDAQVDIGFKVINPSNVVIHDSTHTVTTDPGTWLWGLPSIVDMPGGTYTFIGSVTYNGVKTERTATYSVVGPSVITFTSRSNASQDGHILESAETSNKGGLLNATLTTFNLGDDAGDRQYRAILSFNTADLPDNAVITNATLKIRKQGLVGTNPFTILGGLKVDISEPFFGTSVKLLASDFQAFASKSAVATFKATPVNNWYSATIGRAGYPYINLTGVTQFRLRFQKDDNDDRGPDYMKFFSGNYATASYRPTLIIEYYVPEFGIIISENPAPTIEYYVP